MSFAQLGLSDPIVRGVRAAGYTQPTRIQQDAIPVILEGHDLVGAAQTGTGKTAAFLLPILSRLLRGHHGLRALVLVPTRELAAQVEENGRIYSRFTPLRVGAVYGGVPIGPQERMLRQDGVDLLVATPGRLLDLDGRQSLSLDDVEILVLDEADRMVDMGFAPDLRRILALLRRNRQTLMFSATMPEELNRVASEALRRPVRVDHSEQSRPVASIAQVFYNVPRERKVDVLSELLEDTGKCLVFVRSKRGTDRLVRRLRDFGHDVAALHGDRTQSQRESAMRSFRNGRVRTLIATDIASRGIDVDDITHVINFDVPRAPEDYVHRVGRTGRMLATGKAVTLVSAEDRENVIAIERFLGRRVERVARGGSPERESSARESNGRAERGRRPASRGDERATEPAHRNGTAARRSRPAPRGATRAVEYQAPASDPSAVHGRRRRLDVPDRRTRRPTRPR